MKTSMTIAIVQDGPVYLDKMASLQKAARLISEAAGKGAELIVFGETWLSGYPSWLDYCPEIGVWDHPATKKVFSKMWQNGITVPGPEVTQLEQLARDRNVTLVIGANEIVESGPGNGTIYNTLLTIDSDKGLVNHHRKLMPTFTEKLLYGHGDGHGLQAVNTRFGRLGGLICWEHWMPLTRQALHESGERIHIAVWPSVVDRHLLASRNYAFEGRCFVIAAGQLLQVKDIPSELTLPEHLVPQPEHYVLSGGSCVIGPDGNFLLEPQPTTEKLIIFEINDLDRTIEEKMTLDTAGHYNRNDIFDFQINRKRKG